MDREKRKFQTVGNTEFVEDVVEVVLHRLLADEHLLGHLFVLVALGDEGYDFAFPGAERTRLSFAAGNALGGFIFRGELADYLRGRRTIEPHFASVNFPNTLYEQFSRSALLNDSRSSKADRLEHFIPFLRGREQDDFDFRVGGAEALQCNKTILPGHGQVEKYDLRLMSRSHFKNFIAMAGFRHDIEIRYRREQFSHAIAKEEMVVGDQDANPMTWIRRR